MSWMIQHQCWRTNCWIHATVSGVVQLVGLPLCSSSSTDEHLVLNRVCHWNTFVQLKLLYLKACWIVVRVSVALFPRLAQNLMYTCCSFLWSIMKTAHVHLATCNLAHWLTRHGSSAIYRCFALPQLLFTWWHQFGIFWIVPHIWYRQLPKLYF